MPKKRACSLRIVLAASVLSAGAILAGCAEDEKDGVKSRKTPKPLHVLELEGVGEDLAASGNHLAVANKQAGITIFETTAPSRPLEVASFSLPLAYKVLVQGTTVFAIDEQNGLGSLDLRNLDALRLTPALSTVELYGYVNDAWWLDETLIFAGDATGVSAFSVENDFQLRQATHTFPALPMQSATSMEAQGDRMVVGTFQGGLSVLQRVSATETVLKGWLATPHRVADLACLKDYCYVTGLDAGLYAYATATESGTPALVSQTATDKAVDLVFGDENHIYVGYLGTGNRYGFYVYNVEDPSAPRLVKTVPTTSAVRDMARTGDVLYVLVEDGRVLIFSRGSLR